MREFKFRFWDKHRKRISTISTIDLHNKCVIGGPCYDTYAMSDVVIMQFIGLQDIEGTDICEGDLLKYVHSDKVFEVVYFDGGFNLIEAKGNPHISLWTLLPWCIVVGNIYENTELLVKEEK